MKNILFTAALLTALAAPRAASAQAPLSAEALFNRGVEEMDAGNYKAGCDDIARSHRLEPLPGSLFSLATCVDRWGHAAEASRLYGEYLDVYEKLPDDRKPRQGERPKVARERREALAREGKALPPIARPAAPPPEPPPPARPAPPPLAVRPPAKSAPPPVPAPTQETSGRRKAAYAIGAVGLAGLAAGAITGGLAVGRKGVIEEHCGAAINAPEDRCDPTGLDAAGSLKTFGLVSTIGFAAGIAMLGTGIVLLVTDTTPSRPSARAPGAWISAELLSAGPGGAMFGARGAF